MAKSRRLKSQIRLYLCQAFASADAPIQHSLNRDRLCVVELAIGSDRKCSSQLSGNSIQLPPHREPDRAGKTRGRTFFEGSVLLAQLLQFAKGRDTGGQRFVRDQRARDDIEQICAVLQEVADDLQVSGLLVLSS